MKYTPKKTAIDVTITETYWVDGHPYHATLIPFDRASSMERERKITLRIADVGRICLTFKGGKMLRKSGTITPGHFTTYAEHEFAKAVKLYIGIDTLARQHGLKSTRMDLRIEQPKSLTAVKSKNWEEELGIHNN